MIEFLDKLILFYIINALDNLRPILENKIYKIHIYDVKSFAEYRESNIIQSGNAQGLVKTIAGTAGQLTLDAGGVSTAFTLGSALLRGASQAKKAWFGRSSIKQAAEIAKKNMLSKAQNRDPSLVDRTVLSYFDVSDQTLQYLTEKEKENISQQAINAVNQNSISSGFSQQIANQILTAKSENIMKAVQISKPKTVVV